MKSAHRFVALFIALCVSGFLGACKTTPKAETKKEVEGVDYILVHDTGSLMPRKVRTKTDVLNSHTKNGDLKELETATGAGARAPAR
jgi:G3E family GTPase